MMATSEKKQKTAKPTDPEQKNEQPEIKDVPEPEPEIQDKPVAVPEIDPLEEARRRSKADLQRKRRNSRGGPNGF